MNLQSILNQVLQGAANTQRSSAGKYVTGGLVGMLLGSRGGRSLGGTALKYGSVAALGAMAWKAYQDYEANQRAQAPAGAAGAASSAGAAATPAGGFAALPAPQMELHGQAMLKAMIAAARSDGQVDERERNVLRDELDRIGADNDTRTWLQAELSRPAAAADVAALSKSPEMAAEIYLASVVVVADETMMERAYLDELAHALKLPPALKTDLEARAKSAA